MAILSEDKASEPDVKPHRNALMVLIAIMLNLEPGWKHTTVLIVTNVAIIMLRGNQGNPMAVEPWALKATPIRALWFTRVPAANAKHLNPKNDLQPKLKTARPVNEARKGGSVA